MKLTCESPLLEDYLSETEEVDFSHSLIAELASSLSSTSVDTEDFVKRAYEYVRDQISHSWDIQSSRITCKASEVLVYREGICYAKSNLLCAIFRYAGIPTGFCYQRITLGDTPDTGYCIHALNAVFLPEYEKWIRLDARGNKAGVNAQFSLEEEKLAFPIREEYEETDYLTIFKTPNRKTMETLKQHTDCIKMYLHSLPCDL